ncbi:MAG TPA: hypothetical protein VFW94_23140 [Candidatus Acidoferrales bacterium]|nr:hypothetical protein [Candidatus Acidoferrales bacterium]
MTPFRRFFFLGCLAVLLASIVQAQTAPQTQTSKASSSTGGWPETTDAKTVAWRAYDAMLIADKSAIPSLLFLAGRWQPLSPTPDPDDPPARKLSVRQTEQRDAMAVVLDALIQLKAPVPANTLRNLAPDFGNAVAVILARMPSEESTPLSLEFFRSAKADHTVQYVSAALLALHPPPGFAEKLLAGIRVRAKVVAVRPGVAIGFGSHGDCFQFPKPDREDWPEMGQYKLSAEASEGASILVAGNEPIYVSREEFLYYRGDDCGGWSGLYLGSQERQALVAQMLGVPAEQIPWEIDPTAEIEFTSLGEFTGDLLGFMAEQQQMYRNTAEALQARGFLRASDVSQSLPVMEVCLDDERRQEPPHVKGSEDELQRDLEPISKDAIKLPARVIWSSHCF